MESAEAILENENNSNVESESQIRQQQSIQITTPTLGGDLPDNPNEDVMPSLHSFTESKDPIESRDLQTLSDASAEDRNVIERTENEDGKNSEDSANTGNQPEHDDDEVGTSHVSAEPTVSDSSNSSSSYKACCICQSLNKDTSLKFCNWKGFDFCGEICLGKFLSSMKKTCSNCNAYIPIETSHSFCTRVGTDLLSFCKASCSQEFITKFKTCACCKQDLSSCTPIVASVGADKEPKKFCSKKCVEKFEEQFNNVEIVHVEIVNVEIVHEEGGKDSVDVCSVCASLSNEAKHVVRFQTKTFKLCSDACLSSFQYTNNISFCKCDSCGDTCTTSQSSHFIQFEGVTKRFCSDKCIGAFRVDHRKLTSCVWCSSRKINFDMIERQDENNDYQLFCSLNCLSLFRINLQAKSNQAVECDKCKKIALTQYHLTMSDASVRNFWSYACVMAFQSQFTDRITPSNPSPNQSQQAAAPLALAVQPQQENFVPPHSHGTRNRGRKTPSTRAKKTVRSILTSSTSPTPASVPVISSVISLASENNNSTANNISGQKLQEKTATSLLRTLDRKGVLVTGDGKQQIVVETPLPKMMKNKAIQCKPLCQTKATACRPHSQPKETKTDDKMGKQVIVPVPVPIYIPMPTVMYTAPAPVLVPIPIPIPVPIFIPTTRRSAKGIIKTIKEIQERMPADSLETEVLMMAETVASDGKLGGESDSDVEDLDNPIDDSDHFVSDPDIEWTDEESSTNEEEEENPAEPAPAPRLEHPDEVQGSYQDEDPGPLAEPAPFQPANVPGIKELTLDGKWTKKTCYQFMSPGSFFSLFFTKAILDLICMWTNKCAMMHGPSLPGMFYKWKPLDSEQLSQFIALLMYMSIVRLPRLSMYWSKKSLLRGLWAKRFMTRFRFLQIQTFLTCCDPGNVDSGDGDKLAKVRNLEDYIKRKLLKFWQPGENISIDERMVPNKVRYGRRMLRDKPTKKGMKLWVLADSSNGYTYNFDFCLGKGQTSHKGLAYDVVMKLCEPLYHQGYKLYVDNFDSSVGLFDDLFKKKIYACGTVNIHRKGIPKCLKNSKLFLKSPRGSMKWVRRGNLLFLQWKDINCVSFISSFHRHAPGNILFCNRRSKVAGKFRRIQVRQPKLVDEYNRYMGGVVKSCQVIGKYKILHRTVKFWKTILYHCLDIARVNSFILFQQFRKDNPDIEKLKRHPSYSQLDYTVELITDIAGISENEEEVPGCEKKKNKHRSSCSSGCQSLKPEITSRGKNCKRCWRVEKKERKPKVRCVSCGGHFCFTQARNCLILEHNC